MGKQRTMRLRALGLILGFLLVFGLGAKLSMDVYAEETGDETYSVADCSIWVKQNPCMYTGKAQTPEVEVYDMQRNLLLVEGKDYTLSYANNINVGKATVVVTGKGTYTGKAESSFIIVDLAEYEYAIPKLEFVKVDAVPTGTDGKVSTGDAKVTIGFEVDSTISSMNVYPMLSSAGGVPVIVGPITCARPDDGIPENIAWTPSVTEGKNHFTYTFNVPTLAGSDKQVWETSEDIQIVNGVKEGDLVGICCTSFVDTKIEGEFVSFESEFSEVAFFTMTSDSEGETYQTEEKKISISEAIVDSVENRKYTGKAIKPAVTVTVGDETLVAGTDYTVSYKNNIEVGTATGTITGIGDYTDTKTFKFKIVAKKINPTINLNKTAFLFNNKVQTPTIKSVKIGTTNLKKGQDYTVKYSAGRKNVGQYKIKFTFKGNYSGTKTVTYKITKAVNPATFEKKTVKIKASAVKSGSKKFSIKKLITVKKPVGKVTYKKVSGKAAFTVTKAGNVTVKKGTKAGTYTIKVKVAVAGNKNYKAKTKTLALKIIIK